MSNGLTEEKLKANLGEQLNEVEILACMYPGERELSYSDPAIIHDIQEYLNGGGFLPSTIQLTLCLDLCGQSVEVCAQLPRAYPSTAQPEIYIRS